MLFLQGKGEEKLVFLTFVVVVVGDCDCEKGLSFVCPQQTVSICVSFLTRSLGLVFQAPIGSHDGRVSWRATLNRALSFKFALVLV